MRILIYGINYAPELTGIGKYTGEMGSWLVEQGHQVDVITAFPYYPEWQIHKAYQGKKWHTETIAGAKVMRSPLYVPSEVTGKSRIVHELSFGASSLRYWFPRFFKKYDAVISVCPPIQMGVFPYLHQLFTGTPFIFHVQDLQLDAAITLGLVKPTGLLFKFLARTERFLFKKAHRVTTISAEMKKRIAAKGIDHNKIKLLPNWVKVANMQPSAHGIEAMRKQFNILPHQQVVLYSGNVGNKQGLEIIPTVAEKMAQTANYAHVQFIIVGRGAARVSLQKIVESKKLSNVLFGDLVPFAELPNLLGMAHLHLITQKKNTTQLLMPSKLTGILAVGGVPVVSTENGSELYNTITHNNLGYAIEPENPQALFEALTKALNTNNQTKSQNAATYAKQFLDINSVLTNLTNLLQSL